MKNKKIIFVIILLILICLSIGGFFCYKFIFNKTENENTIPEDVFVWQAKHIWIEDNTTSEMIPNEWVAFRKTFNIKSRKDINNVIARIAADSKYILYINDEIVTREGGLKRGEKISSTYYDEIDITNYLTKGENTISILVWHFGRSGFSHIDSGKGCLIFQAKIGENVIISDNTWKTIYHPGYLKDTSVSDKRLSESNILFDAKLDIPNWYKKDFDDSSWKNAIELGNATSAPWGELIKRDIPLFYFSEKIEEYENFSEYKDKTFEEDTLISLELPENIQFMPYFKVDSEEGKDIYIALDEKYDEDGKEHRVHYITKKGIQEYESPTWINGDKVYYFIPKGTKVISLGYRKTSYDTEVTSKFDSSDEDLNKLWVMANRTLKLNMRDNFMDCPDRERALWWGDTSISMEQAMYTLDDNAKDLYKKAVKTLIGWKEGSLFMTVVPSQKSNLHLPVQMLLGIGSMYNYYDYTGDKEFLELVYPHAKEYLNNWNISEDSGLASINNYLSLWTWGDSSGECDYPALENAWYFYALDSVYKMAEELGYEEDINTLKQRRDDFKKSYNEYFWTKNGYKDVYSKIYDQRVNAIAVISGIADEDKYEVISKLLSDINDNTPFMEKYILEALCIMDEVEVSQNRIKSRYSEMLNLSDEYSTLWEYFDFTTGSKNHAWSGGTTIIMERYYAGISPLKPGYEEIKIKSNLGSLTYLNTEVEVETGKIILSVKKEENNTDLKLNVPAKTLVGIEKILDDNIVSINGKIVYENNEIKQNNKYKLESEDDKYLYFYIDKGEYEIVTKSQK